MKLKGNGHVYDENIDTDRIIPVKYKKTLKMQQLAVHFLKDLNLQFHNNVQKRYILVAGGNFGYGSSRE